jgi:hypothetical protein
MATRTCQSEMATVTFYFDFGARSAGVRSLEVNVHRGDDPAPVANFKERFNSSHEPGRSPWKLQLDSGTYELRIRVATDRRTYRFKRTAKVTDNAAITVRLEDSLPLQAPAPTPPAP